MVRCRGGQELTVGILVGVLSCLREWLHRVTTSRQLCDETLVPPRERNDIVLIATVLAARILVQLLMISQLVCVVHEVLRVAEGALRHVLGLVRRLAAGVVGLRAPLAVHLRARRPLLHLLVMALSTHLF